MIILEEYLVQWQGLAPFQRISIGIEGMDQAPCLVNLLETLFFSAVQNPENVVSGSVLQKFMDVRHRNIHLSKEQNNFQCKVLGRGIVTVPIFRYKFRL